MQTQLQAQLQNPVVNVNVDCDNKEDAKKKDKEKHCECKGIVNDQRFPNFRDIVSICADCTNEGSSVFLQGFNAVFSSTTVAPPGCFTDGQVTHLIATGTGVYVDKGVPFTGTFSIMLSELPAGDFDRLNFVFSGSNPTAGAAAIFRFGGVPDGALTITPCHVKDCGCRSNTALPAPAALTNLIGANSEEPQTNLRRNIIMFSDGRVEDETFGE
ncbi:hypothetical protein D1872_250260 [compost metagenome]